MNKLRVLEAFSGIGTQSMALNRINANYEVVGFAEIDERAIDMYCHIHDTDKSKNLGDISKLDVTDIPKFDLMTYSFPCQDLSNAGKGKGIVRGETRSGLLWECERIIKHHKPKYLLMENVKNLLGKKHFESFTEWTTFLEEMGYKNFYKVINATEVNVAQNRERVFMVSILDADATFEFPKAIPLTKSLEDYLETEVVESYYMSQPFKVLEDAEKSESGILVAAHFTHTKFLQKMRIYGAEGVSPTLLARDYKDPQRILVDTPQGKRVRKLTAIEYLRIMGVDEHTIEKMKAFGQAKTHTYKQAGNAIVVDVLASIFKEMLKDYIK